MMPVEGGREGGREDEEEDDSGGGSGPWALKEVEDEEEDEGGREGGAKKEGGIYSCSRRRRNFKCPYFTRSRPVYLPGTEGRRTAWAEEKSTRGRSCWIASTSAECPRPGGARGGGREGGREVNMAHKWWKLCGMTNMKGGIRTPPNTPPFLHSLPPPHLALPHIHSQSHSAPGGSLSDLSQTHSRHLSPPLPKKGSRAPIRPVSCSANQPL